MSGSTVVSGMTGAKSSQPSTAVVTLFLCSVAVSGGIILIEELDNPLSGLIHVPPDAMRKALVEIAH